MRLLKNTWLLAITILISLSSFAPNVQAQATSADQYVASGQQLLSAKNYTQAAQYFYAAVKLDPNNATAYQGLGNCYYMAGRKSDALSFYQRALTLQPANTQLAQFVQTLQGQLNGGGAMTSPMASTTDPLTQGSTLFQQKQYAASIPYFQQAAQQNPNDYRPFYYAGYAYYMTGNARFAAFYFAVANLKQPNASIQAYADRIKSGLSPDDQQWVSDQLSKYGSATGSATASTTGSNSASSDNGVNFGFNFMGGSSYFFSNPSQIVNGVTAAQAAGEAVSLGGTSPNMVAMVGMEPYLQFGQNFELDLGVNYIPVGELSYQWVNFAGAGDPNNTSVYGYTNTFQSSMVVINLGLKVLFGDDQTKFYIGLGGSLAPISMSYTKLATDVDGNLLTNIPEDPSSGNYSTVAFGGYAKVGVDFYLSKGLALGPFVGVQVLTATNFQNGANTLLVNQNDGDVGIANTGSFTGVTNTTPLTLDYTNVNFGVNLKFSF